jgi:transposase
MDVPACAGCRERDARSAALDARSAALEARVAELEALVRELTAKLGRNASNSSTPPSANPLGAPKPVVKKKTGRKRGAQPGHPPHLKQLLPPARLKDTVVFVPERCHTCAALLPASSSADDPPPTRHQVIDLPANPVEVVEFQGQARRCPCCGDVTHAPIPREHLQHSVGPRLSSAFSFLTGCQGMSKRGVEEFADVVLGAPISLGTVSALEQEMSAALASAHQQVLEAVRAAAVKHADETSWKRAGKLCWLWTAATATAAVFVIHAKRSALGLTALLGETIQGILCSDRWGPYDRVPAERRQVCWAHLQRDFQKVVDRGGEDASAVGRAGLRRLKKVFAAWHAFKGGTLTRQQLQAKITPLMQSMNRVLMDGWLYSESAAVRKLCDNLLEWEPALWTFVTVEGVEPTNNFMERLLRRAVLWRRRSFGCHSEAGCRFVERILTAVQTCRLQERNTLEYLQAALAAHRAGEPSPKLLPAG